MVTNKRIGYASITIRVYHKDWLKLRSLFTAKRNEPAASYFERLSKYLEDLKGGVENE